MQVDFGGKKLSTRKKTIPFTNSTLNCFFIKDGIPFMATASNNFPCPLFAFIKEYPDDRPVQVYSSKKCVHDFSEYNYVQRRKGDEMPDLIYMCKKCSKIVQNLNVENK